jgi:hypothetical protein
MDWKLIECEDVPCTLDNSGVYTVINRVVNPKWQTKTDVKIRVDIMGSHLDQPLISYQGEANAVRKAVIAWLTLNQRDFNQAISSEHASYIGYEIMRARSEENYVQA